MHCASALTSSHLYFFPGKYDCEFDNDGMCDWELNGLWKVASSMLTSIGPKSDVSFGIGRFSSRDMVFISIILILDK